MTTDTRTLVALWDSDGNVSYRLVPTAPHWFALSYCSLIDGLDLRPPRVPWGSEAARFDRFLDTAWR